MCYKIVNEFSLNLTTLGDLNNIINQEYISLSLCSYGRANTNISLSTLPPPLPLRCFLWIIYDSVWVIGETFPDSW